MLFAHLFLLFSMQINVYALYAFDLFDVFLLSTGNNLQQESIITELQNEVHKFPHALEGYVLPYHKYNKIIYMRWKDMYCLIIDLVYLILHAD